MRSLLLPLLIGAPFLLHDKPGAVPERSLELAWSSSPELDVPESVLYDREREALYVSCINGKPTEKNGKGYISKMTLDGQIGDHKWVKGLHAPKGMAIHDDTLYVSDVDRLIVIDLDHGNIAAKYGKREAKFLNDVTIDPHGRVFVSDMKDQRIYSLENGDFETWKKGKELEQVNGLYWHQGTLYAGTKDRILGIDPASRTSTTVVDGTPSVDGLIAGVDNGFLFSDWEGRVFFSQRGGEPVTLCDSRDQGRHAADIGYKADQRRVYVPTFFDNRVFAYDLKKGE
jgi:hypothetical protein